MPDEAKPKIVIFSGATSTIANTPDLTTSNKARVKYGLPLRMNKDGSTPRFDWVRPQRLAAPVTVYIEQFSGHPLEQDSAELYGPPDGYIDANKTFHKARTSPTDIPVYETTLLPEDGLYNLPYMARQADGQPWDHLGTSAKAPPELTRQAFFPNASRLVEEIDRFGLNHDGMNNELTSRADFEFVRGVPPAGYKKGLPAAKREHQGEGDIAPEVIGYDFFPYGSYRTDPPRKFIAQAVNRAQKALDSGKYAGAIWMEGSPNIEETIYCLNLFMDTTLPICGVSSQRAHQTLANDGDRNIVDSADYIISKIWADEQGRDCVGAVAVLDQQVFTSRDVQKGDARPGGYIATGGHGGVVASLGSSVKDAVLTFRPAKLHTYKSMVNLRRLPAEVMGVKGDDESVITVPVRIKDDDGWLLDTAIPEVRFVKHARYIADGSEPDSSSEVEVLARINKNLADAPLSGFIAEGRVGGGMAHTMDAALDLAIYHGMPVVKVGRGAPEGMITPSSDSIYITGSNLTANKARWVLMACLMKFGALPPAKDPQNPTEEETLAVKAKVKDYQAVFNTH